LNSEGAKERRERLESMDKDHEQIRMKLWCDVYVAHVPEISTPDGFAKRQADVALKDFDERFLCKVATLVKNDSPCGELDRTRGSN